MKIIAYGKKTGYQNKLSNYLSVYGEGTEGAEAIIRKDLTAGIDNAEELVKYLNNTPEYFGTWAIEENNEKGLKLTNTNYLGTVNYIYIEKGER